MKCEYYIVFWTLHLCERCVVTCHGVIYTAFSGRSAEDLVWEVYHEKVHIYYTVSGVCEGIFVM